MDSGEEPDVAVLLLTGTTGAGKTTIAAEISDLLAARRVPNAALDLDALTWQWPPTSPWNTELMLANLTAMWPNYAARGVRHLVLARVLEDRAELDGYRRAVPGADIQVCRLVSPAGLRERRLLARMPAGPSRDWHLRRTHELEAVLDRSAVANWVVRNDRRTPRQVAMEVISTAAWD